VPWSWQPPGRNRPATGRREFKERSCLEIDRTANADGGNNLGSRETPHGCGRDRLRQSEEPSEFCRRSAVC
jgi:hypothetical protein